ncbi:MAG: DUF1015 domain-containing protein [Crocinitomicaceae bacterium]
MSKIKPFKAIRPTRDKVYLVASRPYYAYKKKVLDIKLETNPYTFLHVINPERDLVEMMNINKIERHQKSREKLEEFIEQGVFIEDKEDTFYLYRQSSENKSFIGLIAGASIEEYRSGKIRKHEETITSREEHFKDYLKIVECNAEPVLLFHSHHEDLYQLLNSLAENRPEYEFSTTEKIKHEVWLIQDKPLIDRIQSYYEEIDRIYIADGHHRCASSDRLSQERNARPESTQNFFMAYFISEKNLEIIEYNRLVKDLNGLSVKEFFEQIEKNYRVELMSNPIKKVTEKHCLMMYLDHQWYLLSVKEGVFDENDPVAQLDTAILTQTILAPILGISDLKTDDRIEFIQGSKGLKGVVKKVDAAEFRVGFVLHPVSVSQLKNVADNQRIMPPKSTWIEPKLRSGLTMYPIYYD